MNAFKYASICSFCFLVACAPLQRSNMMVPENNLPGPVPGPLAVNGASAANVTSWNLDGQLAARNQAKAWTASVNWVQNGPNHYQIRLMGPIGTGTVLVERRGNVVVYTDGPTRVTAANAERLLRERTGVHLPVHHLYYWARGLKAPGKMSGAQYNANHQLVQFNQDGYTVTYSQYTVVRGVALPTNMQLVGHGVVIKLAVNNWKI